MQPFAQFRLWMREGPRAERRAACVAMAIALVLASLALVPVSDQGSDEVLAAGAPGSQGFIDQSAPGAAPGAAGGGAAVPGGTVGGVTGGSVTGADGAAAVPQGGAGGAAAVPQGGAGGAAAGAAGGPAAGSPSGTTGSGQATACSGALGASAPGVTAKEVRIAVALTDLAGAIGNEAFDIREDGPEIFQAVTDHINDTGGVACGRKLVTKVYKVNPADANDQQAKCLQMVQDNNFIAINFGSYITPVSMQCFVNNKLPLQLITTASADQVRQSYPYLYGTPATIEQSVRNAVLGLAARGFFAKPGFAKLGLLLDSCVPAANAEIDKDLAASGVASADVIKYTLDCQLISAQQQLAQAVVRMKSEGASHVLLAASLINNQSFTRLAAQQDLRPKYATTDKGTSTAPNGSGNWDPSFNGALALTFTRSGELNAGIRNPELQACDKLLTSRGRPGIKHEAADSSAAWTCDALFFLDRALDRAGANPTRLSLVQNLGGVGKYATASAGDSLWNTPGKLTGGDYARLINWDGSCRCWKLSEPNFGPKY